VNILEATGTRTATPRSEPIAIATTLQINPSLRTTNSSVRFEVFAAVSMKNAVLWDIKPSLYFTGDTLRLRYRVQPVNAM
jgi:hypothetical protein